MAFRDLPPKYDPKGGSPKTPSGGIRVSEFPDYQPPPPITINGNGHGVWKVIACSAITALMGMTVAFFTALRGQGASPQDLVNLRREMQTYTDTNSPYSHDKNLIALQQQSQDEKIGILTGLKDRIFDRLNKMEETKIIVDRDLQDHDNKIKMLTNYIEAEKFPKK